MPRTWVALGSTGMRMGMVITHEGSQMFLPLLVLPVFVTLTTGET